MSEYIYSLSNGDEVSVIITTRRGLRNITVRPRVLDGREIHISKPWLVSDRAALDFLESKRRWVENVFAKCPPKQRVVPNMRLEFLGKNVLLLHDSSRRANVYDADKMCLVVGGGADMFERRVRDFIKAEFLVAVKEMVHTAPREFWPRRISIRDTTSRWGSCSSSGTISFSWRLAFAPLDVMRYVVMHELAHTRHMNHSPEFWATVRELYGFGVERARRWLTQHGGELHQWF